MHTEAEARKKWCPHARYVIDGGESFPVGNRFDDHPPLDAKCNCIASECMAWRHAGYKYIGPSTPNRNDPPRMGENDKNYVCQGYCGLAGAP